MEQQQSTPSSYGETMHRRRIAMPDGRYLIFYTFNDDGAAEAPAEGAPPMAEPRPEMTEERRV